MKAQQLRKAFTEFFEESGHTLVPSSSLIPHDESLLFTNSGMVPFKSYFLGNEHPLTIGQPPSKSVFAQEGNIMISRRWGEQLDI